MLLDSAPLPPLLRQSTRLAALATCVLLAWSALAEVDEAVKGQGRTISSGQNKMVQHMEGGLVADILIQEGQMVEKDQPLFRIHNVSMSSTLRENSVRQRSLEATLVRLRAEIDDTPLVFDADIANTETDLLQNERQQYEHRKAERQEGLRIAQDQINQKQLALRELNSKVENLKRELATAREQFDIVSGLQKAGAASANRMLEAKSKVNRFQTELSTAEQNIPITQAELSEAQGKLEELRARQKNTLLEELQKATLESQQLAERLRADADRIQRTDVVSPVKGIVNKLYLHTLGGTVRPGETLAEITPLDDSIIVEARVAPEHRAKIWVGQPVKVKVSAFEYASYGTIPGAIIDISADSFTDEQSRKSYYRIKVLMDKIELEQGKRIMPGMLTEVNILTGKRTVLDYLLRPLSRVREDAFSE